MNKKLTQCLLLAPLVVISLFNISFIVCKLSQTESLRQAFLLIKDYFIGFHLIPLFLVLFVIIAFYLFKKISFSLSIYQTFLVLLLFLISINISLIPELIEKSEGQEKFDFSRKDSSLKEAISKSPARNAESVNNYFQMNRYLKNKTLIIPPSVPVEKDHFFRALITPGKIITKVYNYELNDQAYESLKNHPQKIFHPSSEIKGIENYIILDVPKSSDEFILFIHDEDLIFVPSFSRENILNFND